MAKAAGGRPSIYSPKDGTRVYRIGALTMWGQRKFESVRGKLKKVRGWKSNVSDADVTEFLLRDQQPPK